MGQTVKQKKKSTGFYFLLTFIRGYIKQNNLVLGVGEGEMAAEEKIKNQGQGGKKS